MIKHYYPTSTEAKVEHSIAVEENYSNKECEIRGYTGSNRSRNKKHYEKHAFQESPGEDEL